MKSYFIYILTNKRRLTFYIGVTNDLKRRIYKDKNELIDAFKKNILKELAYYQKDKNTNEAIEEKKIKNWHRDWKINLIKKTYS